MTEIPRDPKLLKVCMEEGHMPIKAQVKKTFAAKIAVPFKCDSGDTLHACARCGLLYFEGPKT